MKVFTWDWSNRPIEPKTRHIFSEKDLIFGDFGDHILIHCPTNNEDYIIRYDYESGRKVLRKKVTLCK